MQNTNHIKLKRYKVPLVIGCVMIAGIFLFQYLTFIPEYSNATQFSTPLYNGPATDTRTLSQISTMQEMTTGICNRSANLESKSLTDTRDGQKYQVTKLVGNTNGSSSQCWMTMNMNYNGGYRGYTDSTYGGYYNWDNAKKVCSTMTGWVLPGSSDYARMTSSMGGTKIVSPPYNFQLGGIVNNPADGVQIPNVQGYYWTITPSSEDSGYGYAIYFDSVSIKDLDYSTNPGAHRSVRCVARTDVPDEVIEPDIYDPNISVTVPNMITLDVSDSVDIATESNVVNTGNFTATVSSNKDYSISLNAAGDSTSLINYKDGDKVGEIKTIEGNEQPEVGKSGWGIRTCAGLEVESCVGNYLGLPIKGETNSFVDGTKGTRQYLFQIGIGIGLELPSGTYSTSIQVTASQK